MNDEYVTQLAIELQKLGVSQAGVIELLSHYPLETIDRQIRFMPLRKAKRPSAFIVDAIRNDYTPPKEFFYAKAETESPSGTPSLDQDSQLPPGHPDADTQGYGAQNHPLALEIHNWMEPGRSGGDLAIPRTDQEDWPQD